MPEQDRQELLDQANTLGLEFPPNIKTNKLKGMIEKATADLPPAEPEEFDDNPPPSPARKPEPEEEEEAEEVAVADMPIKSRLPKAQLLKRLKVKKARDAAFKTRVVTLTNKDPRENDVMTTAYLSFENQFFGLSKLVPLDIPVELEAALIHIAESTLMTLHKDEIVDGRRTGNKVPVSVKKFAVSYSSQEVQ